MKFFKIFLLLTAGLLIVTTSADFPVSQPCTLVQDANVSEVYYESENVSKPLDPVREMVSFVQEAVTYARMNEKEDVLKEFSDRNGTFFRGNLYIYAYDFDGITIAHPLQTELIGKSRLDEKDAGDELYIKNLRDSAINGSGFVVFHYVNPAHNNTVEKKLGYVEKVDDTWWLGSGIYGENVTIPNETFLMPE
ncbi:MAG: histidine kinase [Methanomicrobiales archaeon]|nr:histidine kinase [Methanomicrobiales archaeon]